MADLAIVIAKILDVVFMMIIGVGFILCGIAYLQIAKSLEK